MIPETLDGWSRALVEQLLRQGVFESDRFDFKESLPHPKADADKLRLTKTCAAFANSGGGFLIFGIKDSRGLTPDQRLIGIDPQDDLPERFGNFPAAAEPSVDWKLLNPPLHLESKQLLHVVWILSSPRRPHGVLDQDRWWFCKRTSKGTEAMSLEEIRGLFVDRSRRHDQLAWLRTELVRIQDLRASSMLSCRQGA